ncbi:dCTP deaminase/dUTPase family protein [Blattabacterium cuenoti]|uniref:hypothetical protein n=1 Tax=Blattabacterium cuenoti TaxID=1653831 RepID=UPI00163C51A8|nr:hypothetical protein [Blattabacterium cuenoti]
MHLYKNFPKVILNNIDNPIKIRLFDRKLISSGIIIPLKLKKHFIVLKKIFIKSICIIHITNIMEVKILLINVCYKKLIIYPKEKIAMIDFFEKINVNWKNSIHLKKSNRGKKCFGSTGI